MTELDNFSNPEKVYKLARKYLGKDIEIKPSTHKDKKYMLLNPETNKWVHFGQMGYEDYTKHGNEKRQNQFHLRNKAWATAPKFSPAWLSYHLLW